MQATSAGAGAGSGTVSEDVAMQIWPTVYDAIAWSEIGEIAIATSEHVELLIPKIRVDQDQPDSLWEKLHLRINAFNPDQIDIEDPLPWASASFGEEISASEVVGLDWSPQGLAKHKRCALAVHTQNLALSIWAPTSNLRSLASWKRHIIINRVLQRYFISLYPEEAFKPGQDKSERLKRLQRVRAFSWSPKATMTRPTEDMSYATLDVREETLIAVSNDNNEIIILRMPSELHMPSSANDARDGASVVGHFSIVSGDLRLPDLSWTFEEQIHHQSYVSKLAWSPWFMAKAGSLMAIIVCATRTKLLFRRVLVSMKPNKINVQLHGHGSDVSLALPWTTNGVLRWLPSDAHEQNLKLIACTGGHVILYGMNVLTGSAAVLATFAREEWDPVASCIATGPATSGNSLFVASHVSTNSTSTVHLDPCSLKPLGDQNPNWKKQALQRKEQFGKDHHLGDNSIVKLWGMAISPMKDLVATFTTVHPSQQPEYLIQSDYRTTLSVVPIDAQAGPADFVMRILRQNISAEVVAFSLKFWIKHIVKSPDKCESAIQDMLSELDEAVERMEQEAMPICDGSLTASLNTKASKAHQMKRLISLFSPSPDSAFSLNMAMIAKLTTTILRLPPASWKESTISQYILLEYKKALKRLPAHFVKQARDLHLDHADMKEQCELCEAEIPLEDLTWARCTEGHEFARCALTFLAIQAPGISKFCGICGKQYIEARYLETDLSHTQDPPPLNGDGQLNSDTAAKKLPTLAQLIFAACDTCIYCGGKFVA